MNLAASFKARTANSPLRRAASVIALLAGLASLSSGASAAPTPSEVAVAEALFREAKALLSQGNYAEACPKLAESQRIDPAGGTLFALALCYEADGKTASAWVVFGEAKAVAERDKRPDRVKSADEHIAALEKKLSVLTVNVAKETRALPGLEVRRDDTALGLATLGVAVPVDPGKHRITASAPGYAPVTLEVELGAAADKKSVDIPALEKKPDEPAPVATAQVTTPPPSTTAQVTAPAPTTTASPGTGAPIGSSDKDAISDPGSGRRKVALVLGGVGVVGIGVGAVFGLKAKSQHDDALARCPTSPCSDEKGVTLNQSAQTSALITDVTMGLGVAAIGAGVIVWLTAPSARSSAPASKTTGSLTIAPTPLPGGAGALIAGRF